MTLDFTKLSSEHTKRLNEIAEEIKAEYTEFVDMYCRKYDAGLFWATPFASRNTYNDDTYLHICGLLLAVECVRDGSADSVIAATKGEYLTLKDVLKGRASVSYAKERLSVKRIRSTMARWRRITDYIIRQFACIIYAPKDKYEYPNETSIVIGPAISTDFDGYCFNDRYLTGIFDHHDGLFLPYYVNTRHIPNRIVFDRIKNCTNYRFLYDRSLMSFRDVSEIPRYWRYANRVKKDRFIFRDMDVSPIVRQSLEVGKSNANVYDGLLMRKMLQRLSAKDVRINTFIQWYEGRPFDVLTASAIREFFPDADAVGYEGYPLTEIILGEYISQYQYASGHSPTKMAIPGRMYGEYAEQFCKDVPLLYVPILRNTYSVRSRSDRAGEAKTILVVMSYTLDIAGELIRGVDRFIRNNGSSFRVLIKNHPTNSGFTVKDYVSEELSFSPGYVEGKLDDCLEGVDAVLTAATTATLEVVFAQVPLVVLYPHGQLGFTCLPGKLRSVFCRIVYDRDEMAEGLAQCLECNAPDNSELDDFLIPLTERNVLQMFGG